MFSEIQYTKFVQTNSKLTGIFLDPLGFHLLLAFAARNKDGIPELVYLHRKSSKLKSVTKSRNYEVTEVGWNNENMSELTTGPILLGTSQGHILETEIEADSEKSFAASQQYWRQVNYFKYTLLIIQSSQHIFLHGQTVTGLTLQMGATKNGLVEVITYYPFRLLLSEILS